LETNIEVLGETYEELKKNLWYEDNLSSDIFKKHLDAKTIFLSATPAEYELSISDKIVEQIIRPTWLLDPITYIYPKSGDYKWLVASVDKLLKQRPHLAEFMDGYSIKDWLEEVFGE
jgi:hypothetical protein